MRRIVTGHVGDDQRHDRCAAGGSEASAGDGRQVLAHGVDLLNGRAALQEPPGELLELRHRHARRRQRQQAGAAAGEEGEQQVVLAEFFHRFQELPGGGVAGLVGYRMAGLDDLDVLGGQAMPVAGDGNALHVRRKMSFNRQSH